MAIADLANRSLSELLDLKGRTAVVTGGARGIGLAISRRLAEAGASIVIGDLDGEGAAMSARALADEFGTEAIGTAIDASQSRAVAELADVAVARFGSLDIWVNNAGIYPPKGFLEMTEENWDAVQAVNLRGAFLGAREAARRMAPPAGKGGLILFIASVSGLRGRANLAHYTASKHGVVGLTKALAIELAPLNIRVLALAPTLVDTPGVAAARQDATGGSGDNYREFVARLSAEIPLGRAGVADDIARVALFCASGLSAFMTGSTIPVDGGATA